MTLDKVKLQDLEEKKQRAADDFFGEYQLADQTSLYAKKQVP